MRKPLALAPLVVLVCLAVLGCQTSYSAEDTQGQASLPASASNAPVGTSGPTAISFPSSTPNPSAIYSPSPTPNPSAMPLPSPTPTALPPLVVVDPGHGGRDLGAVHLDSSGRVDFTEGEVNLDLALRVRDELIARGYRVLLTRDGDYSLNEDRVDVNGNGWVDYVDEAQARVDMINASGADLLLSIHQNTFYWEDGTPAEDVGGTVTFYNRERPFSDESLRFARLVQESLVAGFGRLGHDVRDRGVEADSDLETPDMPGTRIILLGPKSERIVRPCQVPGVLSEALFLTHTREAELARDPEALDVLAAAYADAVSAYFTGDRSAEEAD